MKLIVTGSSGLIGSEVVGQNREGDHLCYISDLSKMKEHYPGWDITQNLDDIFGEIVDGGGCEAGHEIRQQWRWRQLQTRHHCH